MALSQLFDDHHHYHHLRHIVSVINQRIESDESNKDDMTVISCLLFVCRPTEASYKLIILGNYQINHESHSEKMLAIVSNC